MTLQPEQSNGGCAICGAGLLAEEIAEERTTHCYCAMERLPFEHKSGVPGCCQPQIPCCEGCCCTCGTAFPFSCECHDRERFGRHLTSVVRRIRSLPRDERRCS